AGIRRGTPPAVGAVQTLMQDRLYGRGNEGRGFREVARRLRLEEAARRIGAGAAQVSDRDLAGILPAPHDAGDLVGFEEPVHAAAQAVLVLMLARTEVLAGSRPDTAQRFTAEQTC